jgi:hypothetical protein
MRTTFPALGKCCYLLGAVIAVSVAQTAEPSVLDDIRRRWARFPATATK